MRAVRRAVRMLEISLHCSDILQLYPIRLIHERQLFKSEDVRRVDMNVITNDFSQIQAFPLNAPSKAACTLPRQTPTFSNKRQQTPTVGSVCASSWCLLVIVGYCRKSSTCSVGLGKVAECLTNVERFPTF